MKFIISRFVLFLNLIFCFNLSYGGDFLTLFQKEDYPFSIEEVIRYSQSELEPKKFKLRSLRELNDSNIQELFDLISKSISEQTRSLIEISTIICLDFSGSHLGNLASSILFKEFSVFTHLTQLVLTRCNLQTEDIEALAQILKKNKTLCLVDLSYNKIKAAEKLILAVLINSDSAIECLSLEDSSSQLNKEGLVLSDNLLEYSEIEKEQLQYAFLYKDKYKNKILSIEENGFTIFYISNVNVDHLFYVAPLLERNECQCLKISFIENDLANSAGSALSKVQDILINRFENQKILDQLDLSNFGKVSSSELSQLVYIISMWAPVSCLNLTGMSIGNENRIQELVKSLEEYPKITELVLEWNAICDEGAILLAELLKKDRTLKRLSLASNEIKDKGAITLVKAIESNQSLQELDLSGNNIGIREFSKLSEGVCVWLGFRSQKRRVRAKQIRPGSSNHVSSWFHRKRCVDQG